MDVAQASVINQLTVVDMWVIGGGILGIIGFLRLIHWELIRSRKVMQKVLDDHEKRISLLEDSQIDRFRTEIATLRSQLNDQIAPVADYPEEKERT